VEAFERKFLVRRMQIVIGKTIPNQQRRDSEFVFKSLDHRDGTAAAHDHGLGFEGLFQRLVAIGGGG